MTIEELLKEQDRLAGEFAETMKSGAADAAMLARPVALQQARAATLKSRMEGLDARRATMLAQFDAEMEELTLELRTVETRMEADGKIFAPALDAVARNKGKRGKG